MDIKSVINKKRNRRELDRDEIKYFVGKYAKGEITEAQAAALMSYIYVNGLTLDEIVIFTQEVAESGEKLDLTQFASDLVDKHSTGGVGDKISFILLPIISALDIPVAKISSKGFGIAGGTIDKLQAIPGFNANISIDRFEEIVHRNKIGIVGQELNLAPAESKLYRLRNEIGCGDSIPLIAISLMSLKLATGSQKIVFDLTCGKGTYLKDRDEAKKLGKLLVILGKRLNRSVGYTITLMDEPVGYAVGNILEVKETIKALNGKMAKDIQDTIFSLGSLILALAYNEKDMNVCIEKIKNIILSGKAMSKFKLLVSSQGGDTSYLDSPDKFPEAKYILPIYASENGFIKEIDAELIGDLARYLGAGRMNDNNEIDNTSGFIFEKKIGDEVKVGDILAYVHANDEKKAMGVVKNIADAYKFSDKKIISKSRVLDMHGI